MAYQHTIGGERWQFSDLREVMAKATPLRSGDALAGVAATSAVERMAARLCLADIPLSRFLSEALIPYESDEVTRLILDTHSAAAFAPIAHLTVGDFRNWLLAHSTDSAALAALAPGITPEMAAAVSKLMRNQDLIAVARKCRVVTRFRNTIGLPGHLAVRLQPNHPTDDLRGIAASMIDGLLYGAGDAVIGVNPATDSIAALTGLVHMLGDVIDRLQIPTQSCAHACDQHHPDGGARRAGGPGVPVHRGHRGGQRKLWYFTRSAEGSARGSTIASPWHVGRQRHVL